jgi:hypothetical protein
MIFTYVLNRGGKAHFNFYLLAPLPLRENQPCILTYFWVAIASPILNIQIPTAVQNNS